MDHSNWLQNTCEKNIVLFINAYTYRKKVKEKIRKIMTSYKQQNLGGFSKCIICAYVVFHGTTQNIFRHNSMIHSKIKVNYESSSAITNLFSI